MQLARSDVFCLPRNASTRDRRCSGNLLRTSQQHPDFKFPGQLTSPRDHEVIYRQVKRE